MVQVSKFPDINLRYCSLCSSMFHLATGRGGGLAAALRMMSRKYSARSILNMTNIIGPDLPGKMSSVIDYLRGN